jgi:protoporphyrinogen oxidase
MAAPRHQQGQGAGRQLMPAAVPAAMRIGIIGGGLMGLAAAQRLSAAGHAVTVFERATQPGGLATWHDFGPFIWDRFYHVILPTDAHLVGFIDSIGLKDELRWCATQTGYYVDKQFHSLSTNVDFLKFPPLSLWDKARLAAAIIYCSRIEDWRRLESIPVEQFLVRTCGRTTFEKFWKPLLLAKLGVSYQRVSAVFIWSYIKRLFSARDASAAKEHLGHVRGGYKTILDRVLTLIEQSGGRVALGSTVSRVREANGGGIVVTADDRDERFDKVIFTGPVNVLRSTVSPTLAEVPRSGGPDVEYLGVVCMVLVTRTAIAPYYVLNIADDTSPFTGVIGVSNVVDTQETAGLHVTYFPKYVLSDDPLLQRPDEDMRTLFLDGFRRLFPHFPQSDLVSVHINRAVKVQPLQVLNYSRLVPQPRTKHPDFYVINTSQFVNNTLNNNEVIRTVHSFFEQFGADFAVARKATGSVPMSRVA